jgi:hypothetical protein
MSTPATALYAGRIYPGLRPFDAEDALLFFGRDPQTDELLRRLDDTRFLAVLGYQAAADALVRQDFCRPCGADTSAAPARNGGLRDAARLRSTGRWRGRSG